MASQPQKFRVWVRGDRNREKIRVVFADSVSNARDIAEDECSILFGDPDDIWFAYKVEWSAAN